MAEIVPIRENPANRLLNEHPTEYQEWAFQLWAYVCGRNVKAVQRRIANPKDGDPLVARDIPYGTVYDWCSRQKWAIKVRDDFRKIAPDLHESVIQNLMGVAVVGSQYYREVLEDNVPLRTKEEIAAVKVKADIIRVAFDRSGFIPWRAEQNQAKPPAPVPDSTIALGHMSDDDLIAAMNRRIEGKIKEAEEWTVEDEGDVVDS